MKLRAILAFALATTPALAGNIVTEWADVKAPPAPTLQVVQVDPKTTAFLILDIVRQTCNAQRRPRCLPTVAPVQALLQRARAAGMPVAYSLTNDSVAGDILPELAPIGGEPIVKRGVDKFLDTDLDAQLKSRGIKTVIIVGVAAQGAVMATMIESVLHGYDVVLAVDGVSGDPYAEQYVAWHLMNGPNLAGHGSLTTTDMIHF